MHILGYKHLHNLCLVYSLAVFSSGCVPAIGNSDSAVSVAAPYAVCAGEQKLPLCRLLSGNLCVSEALVPVPYCVR